MSPNPTLARFSAGYRSGNEAFNRGDFATAFAGLALREGVPVRVREFSTSEEALSAAGLDPATAAELR